MVENLQAENNDQQTKINNKQPTIDNKQLEVDALKQEKQDALAGILKCDQG